MRRFESLPRQPVAHSFPKGPCRYMAYTWALKGLPYYEFGAYVCTVVVLGPFGFKCCMGSRPVGVWFRWDGIESIPSWAFSNLVAQRFGEFSLQHFRSSVNAC